MFGSRVGFSALALAEGKCSIFYPTFSIRLITVVHDTVLPEIFLKTDNKQESCAIAKLIAQYAGLRPIYGYPEKMGQSLAIHTLSIPPPKILYAYHADYFICVHSFSCDFRVQFWVGLRTPNLGEGEAVGGQGWYHSKERWWVPMGRPYSNFYSIFVSEILPLLFSSTSLCPYPTSSLPKFLTYGMSPRTAGRCVRVLVHDDHRTPWPTVDWIEWWRVKCSTTLYLRVTVLLSTSILPWTTLHCQVQNTRLFFRYL